MADFLKTEIYLLSEGAYFHVRCCAHILNLIVQDGLKELDDVVIKVRESVKYYKGSQLRKKMFKDSVAYVELQLSKGPKQDVLTQWNSTYMMLESFLYYKKTFIHLQKMDANYSHCPTSEEWGKIERIFKFLQVFYEVTCAFSGSKYPATNLYFTNVLMFRVLLHKEKYSHARFMKNMATRMYAKFEKYWAEFSTVMAIVVVLDPRYKFQMVEWGYEKNKSKYGQAKSMSDSQKELHGDLDGASSSPMMDFDKFSTKVTSQVVKVELECYLEEKLMPRVNNFNILDYWRTREIRYPTVARMAGDILVVPISIVASKSAFSKGGRVLDAYRSSLAPSIVEAIICLRNWVFGEAKMESQLEELCDAIMMEKMDDEQENHTESGSRVGESESQVA
ncbi:zinc finger BED domain-containing protein RICESLEEPER 2-like [Lactuca sativa]|uniref:zinc finger BED domain-containing protein RICESLEEPER 2-like n=1 Tax=Lactuca sativa TaxID=4236 RepID=UPI000CD8E0E2|nr:zinc finger BED domain-containing protein RICESLEEPER 2-like [Lactuca sativa]